MKLSIDSSVLEKYNVSLGEFLVLYISNADIDIKECTDTVIAKGLADYNLFSEGKIVLSDNTKSLLSSIIIDSDQKIIDKDSDYQDLAKELRKIYPKGTKPGTTYSWRGTTFEIEKKLKTLVAKYECVFTKEQAIKATKTYVQSFNGDYTKMRLLKYFILKTPKDADGNVEVSSDLMSLIEDGDYSETLNNDWISELK